MKLTKSYLLSVLFVACCISQPLSAAELVSIENVTLIDAGLNDGDSFKVNAGGRELHLRLYKEFQRHKTKLWSNGRQGKDFAVHERTGKPLGDEGFINRIESTLGRPVKE